MNERQPEMRLWRGVMTLALEEYTARRGGSDIYWADWLYSKDFETVCNLADYHPQAARRGFIKSRLISD